MLNVRKFLFIKLIFHLLAPYRLMPPRNIKYPTESENGGNSGKIYTVTTVLDGIVSTIGIRYTRTYGLWYGMIYDMSVGDSQNPDT